MAHTGRQIKTVEAGAPGKSAKERKHAKALARQATTRRRWTPFQTADSYLFAQMLNATARGIIMFGGFLILFAGLAAAHKSLPIAATARLMVLEMPRILLFTLPMALIYGTVHAFSELSSRGEITALQAGGMGISRMMRAPLVWTTLLVLSAYVFQEWVVPHAEQRKDKVMVAAMAKSLGKMTNFRYATPASGAIKRMIQAKLFDPEHNTLEEPSLQFYDDDLHIKYTINAARGIWNETTGEWKFYKGRIVSYRDSGSTPGFSSIKFDEIRRADLPDPAALNKAGKNFEEHIINGDFEMYSMHDLSVSRVDESKRLATLTDPGDILVTRKVIGATTYAIHDKVATPLIGFALVLIAIPLGIRPQRSVGAVSMGLSLIVIFTYYVLYSWTQVMGRNGTANPVLMAYLSLIIAVAVGSYMTWQKSRHC